jgi:hypothetical protein
MKVAPHVYSGEAIGVFQRKLVRATDELRRGVASFV